LPFKALTSDCVRVNIAPVRLVPSIFLPEGSYLTPLQFGDISLAHYYRTIYNIFFADNISVAGMFVIDHPALVVIRVSGV
jgi:hypothetical protein